MTEDIEQADTERAELLARWAAERLALFESNARLAAAWRQRLVENGSVVPRTNRPDGVTPYQGTFGPPTMFVDAAASDSAARSVAGVINDNDILSGQGKDASRPSAGTGKRRAGRALRFNNGRR